MNWFTNSLLPNLEEPSLIVLDNAKCHKSKPSNTPIASKLKLNQVIQGLLNHGIEFDNRETVLELKEKLRDFINQNIEAAVNQAAKEHGHKELFTPPYFSDLQPIELVWDHVKSAIARAYTKTTTLQEVTERLDEQFDMMHSTESESVITSIVLHVDKVISRLQSESNKRDDLLDGGSTTENEFDFDDSLTISDRTSIDDY